MAIKPILFSTPMVQSIKRGEKGATRRAIKPLCEAAPERTDGLTQASYKFFVSPITGVAYWGDCDRQVVIDGKILRAAYKRNDILWVRETWCELPVLPDGSSSGGRTHIYYKADGDLRPEGWRSNWKPSIFMPKEAARLFLRVTNVRVERLQEITVDGVLREGVARDIEPPPVCRHEPEFPRDLPKDFEKFTQTKKDEWFRSFGTARYIGWCKYADDVFEEWIKLWNSLRNPQNISSYGWDANPWVWVIEFEPCAKPVGF